MKINQTNTASKKSYYRCFVKSLFISLCSCALAIPSLGAPNDSTSSQSIRPKVNAQIMQQDANNATEEMRYGWFWGVGLNIGADELHYIVGDNIERKTYFTGGGGLKIGGYVYLKPWFAVRSYLGIDLDANPEMSPPENKRNFYMLYETYSLNLDLIFNVYTSKEVDVGLILGGELDSIKVTLNPRLTSVYSKDRKSFRRILSKAKVGARVMFGENKKYGIELIEKMGANIQVPVSPIVDTSNNNWVTAIHFVMEF